MYRNESDLGEALKHYLPEFGLKREDIFITSKLSEYPKVVPENTINFFHQRESSAYVCGSVQCKWLGLLFV